MPSPERKAEPLVFSCMDRSFEEIREEVLQLDRESQRRLVDEVEERLGPYEPTPADFDEAFRRLQAFDRGEVSALSAEESISAVRRIIAENENSRL